MKIIGAGYGMWKMRKDKGDKFKEGMFDHQHTHPSGSTSSGKRRSVKK